MTHQPPNAYVLGSDRRELERLDRQAAAIEAATRLLLRQSGVSPGMRVLDLGSGPGHVTHLVAELVGEQGAVVGLERDTAMLDVARERTRARGFANVSFQEADVTTWSADEPFDAVVGRLILFHLPDPEAVVRHHLRNLRSGGLMLALDYDIGAARSEPPLELVTTRSRAY